MYKTFDEWSLVTKLKLLSVLTVMFAIILPLWVSPQVLAAGTAAGTVIGNQATATYQDESSNSYTSTSNLVTTTVQPVYSLTVTPDGVDQGVAQSQNATPGAIVYFPYTLTNTGNSAGTFNLTTALGAANGFNPVAGSVKVYWDKDGDGTVSVGDTLLGQDTNNNGVIDAGDAGNLAIGPVAADGQAKLVMEYKIPSSATANQFTYVNVIATSVEDGTKTDNNNFNKTTVQNDAIITVVKAVDKASIDPNGNLKYTLTIGNTGNQAATNIVITDVIPANTTFVSTTDSSGLGTFTYSTNNGTSFGAIPAPASLTTNVKYTLATLSAASSRTIEINVKVNALAQNITINNTAVFGYSRSGPTVVPDANTNTVSTVVNKKSAASITSESATEFASFPITLTGDNALGTDVSTTDAAVPAGTNFYFKNIVTNNGNAIDKFNLQFVTGSSTLPAGASVSFYLMTDAINAANNTSPILDTNGDGIADTGDMAVGASMTIVTKVFIPANASGTNLDAVVTATSTNGGTAKGTTPTNLLSDTTIDRILSITSPGVTIKNIINAGLSDAKAYTSSADGATVSFPIRVSNTGGSNDTFNLSTTGLPAGFSAQFFMITASNTVNGAALKGATSITLADASTFTAGNQVIINGQTLTIASIGGNILTFAAGQTLGFAAATGDPVVAIGLAPVTATGVVAPAATKDVIAVVSVPLGTVAGTYGTATAGAAGGIDFVATSTNNGTIVAHVDDAVIIPEFRTFTLTTDRSGSTPAGGVLFYDHTLTNTGNIDEIFNLTGVAGAGGFSYQLLDSSNNPIIAPVTVLKGASYNFKVKVTVPSGTAIGTVDNAIITARETTILQSKTNTDTTTVIAGYISLVKSVDKTNAKPGDVLVYTITYENKGSQEARLVKIIDMIPANTTFVPGSLSINSIAKTDVGADDTADFNATTANGVTFFVGTGANATTGGTLIPATSGSVSFSVKVN